MEERENVTFSKEKKWSLSCYIPFFNIVTCILASVKVADNQTVRFHCRQGLVLAFIWYFTVLLIIVNTKVGLFLLSIWAIFHLIELIAIFTDTFVILPVIGQIASKIPEFYLYRLLTGKEPSDSWISKE